MILGRWAPYNITNISKSQDSILILYLENGNGNGKYKQTNEESDSDKKHGTIKL